MAILEATSTWSKEIIAALIAAAATLLTFLGTVSLFFWRKRAERRGINSAVLAEVRRLLEVIEGHFGWLKGDRRRFDEHPLIPFRYSVYPKQVKNIGALKGSVVVPVVQFYGYVDFLNALQASREQYKSKEAFEAVYLESLGNFSKTFHDAFKKEFEKLNYIPPPPGTATPP